MDSVDRFIKLLAAAREDAVPAVDVSGAVLGSIRTNRVDTAYTDYAPLAVSASLVIAASLFLFLSLQTPTPVNAAVAELVNPMSMLVP